MNVVEADEKTKQSKKEREAAAEKVRNEGLETPMPEEQATNKEIDLEIEAPGAASKVAEEGSLTIQNQEEFLQLQK